MDGAKLGRFVDGRLVREGWNVCTRNCGAFVMTKGLWEGMKDGKQVMVGLKDGLRDIFGGEVTGKAVGLTLIMPLSGANAGDKEEKEEENSKGLDVGEFVDCNSVGVEVGEAEGNEVGEPVG